jgi:hypothetical protein
MLYHRTTSAAARHIQREGFRDTEGYFLTDHIHRGVWMSDTPDHNEGAAGYDVLFAIDVPADVLAQWEAEYEWVEEGKPYREFLVPAAVVNQYRRVIAEEEGGERWPESGRPA